MVRQMQSFKNFTSSSEIVHFGKVADSSPATSVDLSACEKFGAHYRYINYDQAGIISLTDTIESNQYN